MRTSSLLILLALVATLGCDSGSSDSADDGTGPVRVLTTFYPTTYFVEQIGGDRVEVSCPVPPDADPIFWMPDDAAIAAYQGADLIVLNGAEFEKWVEKVSLPESRVVKTAAGFHDQWLTYEGVATHSHGDEGEHSHEGLDGHTWLNPKLAIRQAAAIRRALGEARPQWDAEFEQGLANLMGQLQALDKDLEALSEGAGDRWVYASHPAYNYLAKQYGWKVVNLDLDPEEMPSDEAFSEIKTQLESQPARHLIWEGTPTPEIIARVRDELGLESVVVSPAEMIDPAELAAGTTYLTIMKENVARLRSVFAAQ